MIVAPLLFAMGSIAQPAAAPPPPPVVAADPDTLRPKNWPTVAPGRMLSGPDWADYNIYPAAARRNDEEGSVRSQLLIDRDGRVIDCVVILSSSHSALDEGTCALMRQIRFEPAEIDGKPVQSSRALQIGWRLGSAAPITASRATATLTLVKGQAVRCSVTVEGPHYEPYRRSSCISRETFSPWLAGLRDGILKIDIAVVPEGQVPAPSTGRLLAMRRQRFEVDGKGDAVNCQTVAETGDVKLLGTAQANACDGQLRRVWFASPEDGEPSSGLFEIRLALVRD